MPHWVAGDPDSSKKPPALIAPAAPCDPSGLRPRQAGGTAPLPLHELLVADEPDLAQAVALRRRKHPRHHVVGRTLVGADVQFRLRVVRRFTPTIEAIVTPDIDSALDDQAAKTAFWNAFKALGPWWAQLPPY